MRKILFIISVFSLFSSLRAVDVPYNFVSCATLENRVLLLPSFLSKGGTGLILDVRSSRDGLWVLDGDVALPLDSVFCLLAECLIQYPDRFYSLLLRGEIEKQALSVVLDRCGLSSFVFHHDQKHWPSVAQMMKQGKRIIIIAEGSLGRPFYELREVCSVTSYYRLAVSNGFRHRFVGNPVNDLTLYYPLFSSRFGFESEVPISIKKSDLRVDALKRNPLGPFRSASYLWRMTGKIPNFFVADPLNMEECIGAVDSLNNVDKQLFNVLFEDTKLSEVHWSRNDSLVTNGFFSVPYYKTPFRLEPFKERFTFSPDMFSADLINSNELKIFQALKHDEPFPHAIVSLDFANRHFRPSVSDAIYLHTIETDSGFSFSGKRSYVDFCDLFSADTTLPISISVRVFPRSFDSYRIIVSKNFSFALKLFHRQVTFTTPVVPGVRDYYAANAELNAHQWYHIVVVFRPNSYVDFYVNGKLVDTQKSYGYQITSNNLMVGANEKGRYFDGVIRDVHIWNRALEESEVELLYREGSVESSFNPSLWWIGAFSCIVLILCVVWFRRVRLKPKSEVFDDSLVVEEAKVEEALYPKICFFGEISIVDDRGENRVLLFPPKILQLFVIIVYYSTVFHRGVSSKEIEELLWDDYEPDKARNNRKYSFSKLRQIMDSFPWMQLQSDGAFWRIEFSEEVFFDFARYHDLSTQSALSLEGVGALLDLLRAPFCSTISSGYFDGLKATVSNRVIDDLLMILERDDVKIHSKLSVNLAETVLIFDEVNEDAFGVLIRSLLSQGKNSLALDYYKQFTKKYFELFGDHYPLSFQSICHS